MVEVLLSSGMKSISLHSRYGENKVKQNIILEHATFMTLHRHV